MSEFLRLSPPVEALRILLRAIPEAAPAFETVKTINALGRVLAVDICAPHSLPEFTRSTVDGYAVQAHDTFGVSESLPGYLSLIGEVAMGAAARFSLQPGTCALMHTGGMLPEGADAVIMLENTQCIRAGSNHKGEAGNLIIDQVEITRPVAAGENVLQVGEDVVAGRVVITAGTRLRPAEIGGCMAFGITQLRVAIKPKIGIISSGDEVVPPDQIPQPGQVRDVNSHSLAALVERNGGVPVLYGIVPDKLEVMKAVAKRALDVCDLVVITAGSSASARDITAEAISSLGNPGVLVHGVNIRPGKPTILAVCNGKPVIGLPGNPVSALVIAGLFVVPVIEKRMGLSGVHPCPSIMAILSVNIPSQAGREDWVAVKLAPKEEIMKKKEEAHFVAEPVFGKSNLIFSLAAADGLVRIPPEVTGMGAGEMVEVILI